MAAACEAVAADAEDRVPEAISNEEQERLNATRIII